MSDDGIGAHDAALDWAVRMADPETADWDGFTIWLEADPRHAERYDRIASALRDAEIAVAATPVVETPRAVAAPWRTRRWIGGAIAASLVASVGVALWSGRPDPYLVETAAGEQRTVTLDDGSSIILAGASSVTLDRSDTRFAVVDRGEMLFRVRHDADRPFRVRAGIVEMVDIGTVFDVRKTDRQTRVAVAEGAVMIDPGGAALRLDPGQAVVTDGTRLERQATDVADVGSWRAGKLAYDDATLADVAEDMSRHLAIPVRSAPSVAGRRFRGTLDVHTIRDDPDLLGALLGVRVRRSAGGWTLEARP